MTIRRPALSEGLPALGDFGRSLQIMINLIGNAVRYSPRGGEVVVTAERDGEWALVSVADRGKGIAPEDQHAFSRSSSASTRASRAATAWGSISPAACPCDGRRVERRERAGRGATFTFRLRSR